MSFDDHTNETITLSMENGAWIELDVDSDSSLTPSDWVYLQVNDPQWDAGVDVNLTYEEAGLLYDRLGLILGRPE